MFDPSRPGAFVLFFLHPGCCCLEAAPLPRLKVGRQWEAENSGSKVPGGFGWFDF